jgi:serine/threonine protein kinase
MGGWPERLGKYEILREVGAGNMATVYLGHDPFINRDVAIKVALPEALRDRAMGGQFRRLFFNEARIAGLLDNQYILGVYDAGAEEELLYLVMEYVSGGRTLKAFCDPENLLPVPKVIELIYKCCRGLSYAHSRDVIHRDIKPSNILLTEEMDVRLADFGIAQLLKGEETQIVGILGSPFYMSPEQVSDKTLTSQTDLYSLGVVLYELLTGHTPFSAENLPALLRKILYEEPPLLSHSRPDLPGFLEIVVKRALAKNPAGRYQTAADFAADLSLALKQQRAGAAAPDTDAREKFQRLRKLSFFRDFLDAELWEVIAAAEWREVRPEALVMSEGEVADGFYVIVQGAVRVIREGRPITTLSAGDCFGEIAYLTGSTRSASILAVEEAIFVKIDSALMERASLPCQLKFMRTFLLALIERLSGARELAARRREAGAG